MERRGEERRRARKRETHQSSLGVLAGVVDPLVGGLDGVAGQGLLDAALVLRAAADVAVVGMLRDALLSLPLHGC